MITEVVAALIWDKDKFMICQRPAHKARGLLWEFVGGKIEPGETKEQALIRECQEELAVTLSVGDVFMDVIHEYSDLTVHLTLFNAIIAEGEPQKLEHNDIKWITPSEISNYEFCPADEEILKEIINVCQRKTMCLVENLYPYFKILKNINYNLVLLIENNINNVPDENEELFYLISSDLIRLLPYNLPKEKDSKKPLYEKAKIDDKSGIVLLKSEIPFLEDMYLEIIRNEKCLKVLENVRFIRNKYIHEPHNIHFAFSLGAKTSCSMQLNYKDAAYSLNTIWLTNIVYELNKVFCEIKTYCVQRMSLCDSKYKEYPCYKFVCESGVAGYNEKLNTMPWQYVEINGELDALND